MNASNRGIICACMIFQPSCFIFILCFSYELGFSMHLVIMTSLRYYDVTLFWSDCNETYTVYVNSKIKEILFVEISSLSPSFSIHKRIL